MVGDLRNQLHVSLFAMVLKNFSNSFAKHWETHYSDGHSVRTSKFFQNFIAPQLEPKNFAQLEPWFAKGSNSLEPWFAKGSNSGGNTNQL